MKRMQNNSMGFAVNILVATILAVVVQCPVWGQADSQQELVSQGAPGASVAGPLPNYGSATVPPPSRQYRIGVDDVLTISVWHEPDLSRTVPVRPDGRISLPLVGEIEASGKTTPELEDELKTSLAQYVKAPELTVIVSQIRSRRVNIIGQVMQPGTFSLTQSMGVLDALAAAGGLRDFAKKNHIYVLRETGTGRRVRMPFDYKAVLSGKKNAEDIMLQANDTVVVP